MSEFDEVLNKKAVALSYDEDKKLAPVIVASGMGYMAEKMVEIANQNGVPVYEDNSLATMLTQLELGAEIPEELYQAIVDIYVYFLNFVPGMKNEASLAASESETDENAAETAETAEENILEAIPDGEEQLPVAET